MYRYDLIGYAFGAQKLLDISWVGYNYNKSPQKPVHVEVKNRNADTFEIPYISQYYKRDQYLVLVFGPINRYCNGFSLYYQGHYFRNHDKGADPEGYSMIVHASEHPIP